MTWTNGCDEDRAATAGGGDKCKEIRIKSCPSCGHRIQCHDQAAIHELPGLPAGVKFDPTDTELLEHLEGKVRSDAHKLHPLIDEFIPTLEGENGICYTHPEKLPGTITCVASEDGETRLVMWGPRIVRRMMKCAQDIAFKEVPSWTILSRVKKDGLVRHFFHRPSKAYTTGTRKRRKVHTDAHGGETRWHKTGKTRPVFVSGKVKGYKKILVLYTNYGKQRKPEKTNWVMHQYHLGSNEEEKDGELVVSKVFYQTQPRQCGSGAKDRDPHNTTAASLKDDTAAAIVDYYNPSSLISYDQGPHDRTSPTHLIPNFVVHADGTSFLS